MVAGGVNVQTLSALAIAVVCIQTVNGLTTKLEITNDGPTILGAVTTFTATLSFINQMIKERSPSGRQPDSAPENLYVYSWEQKLCGKLKMVQIVQDRTCNFSQVYECPEDVGHHTVNVTVRKNDFIFKPFVTSNTSDFQITEHINAKLTITQGISCNCTFGLTTCDVVATNTSVGMGVSIHDPSNFFKGATLLYHWVFGDGFANTKINQPTISHKYKTPGHYEITVNMTAIFPPDSNLCKKCRDPKTGNLKRSLKTMDAIKNLTVHGKTNFQAGVRAAYNISCHASPPINICWYVIPTTTHTSATSQSNTVSCNKTILTNRTWLMVDHWFNNSGGYSIGVYANNTVSSTDSSKNVHARSPNKSQEIAGLTIGILFGIAGCFLCIAVLTTYMRKQNRRYIEVANFDFQGRDRHRSTLGTKLRKFISGAQGEGVPLSQDFNRNRMI